MLQGLRDIPTLSIAMDSDDFAGSNGIYTNRQQHGTRLGTGLLGGVHPGHGDTRRDWQEDCGLRVQGGASRTRQPEARLSLRFREAYGAGKLRRSSFPDSRRSRSSTSSPSAPAITTPGSTGTPASATAAR